MRKDIIDEFIKQGGTQEDSKVLIELTNELDFEVGSIKVNKIDHKKLRKPITYTIILPENPQKPIYIKYYTDGFGNTSFTEAILENHKFYKMIIKTTSLLDKTTLEYIKGYIKIPNTGIYLFEGTAKNIISIRYYQEKYFQDNADDKTHIYLNNLSLNKINFTPSNETILSFDLTTSPYETVNNLFRNPHIITDAITYTLPLAKKLQKSSN